MTINGDDKQPPQNEEQTLMSLPEEKLQDLMDNAKSKSVTEKRLTKTEGLVGEYLSEEPVFTYLYENEQPHFIFTDDQNDTVTIYGSDGPVTLDSGNLKTFLIITDLRVLIIVGSSDGDEHLSLPYEAILAVDYEFSYRGDTYLSIGTAEQVYQIEVTHATKGLGDAVEYITERGVKHADPMDMNRDAVDIVSVCRKCQSEISPEAEKCPNCGFEPAENKKGKLWWGGTAALSMSGLAPVGWVLAGKGLKDRKEAKKGLHKEGKNTEVATDSKPEDGSPDSGDILSELERLQELREKGAITDDEFENLKEDLLQ